MFDNARLRGELNHIHRILGIVAAGSRGRGLVDDLSHAVGGTTAALLWQALYADSLRVVHSAVAADGVVGDDEMDALYDFVFSVARSYAHVIPDHYRDFDAVTDEELARAFLARYAADTGPFGQGAAQHWPGLTLCRRAAEIGEGEALERYERVMSWLISEACRVGGVTVTDPRWRGRVDELDELRQALARDAEVNAPESDSRVEVFLANTGVFAAVQQAASIYEPDPFDVETIYAETRGTFEQMVDRATTPSQHAERGRMLLVLGESGAGKTHLLRGFRRYVHEYGRGFVVYAQLHSRSDDYARYLLQHLVDSLSRPYAGPKGEWTGLHELALGLPRLVGGELKARIDHLIEDTWEEVEGTGNLARYVNRLVDELLEHQELSSFNPDLLRVLLYALYPSASTTARVYRYLRCEDMNAHDRQQIGDIVPRTGKDDPRWMIRDLGLLAFATQQAALVLMIDQAELAGFDESSGVAFQRAVDTLHTLVGEVPSMIAVVACLTDLYNKVKPQLSKFALDRLERDPPIERLQLNRSYPEIVEIVSRRLSWLYAGADAVYRPDQPVFPIPDRKLRHLDHRRTRDVLAWCHEYQSRCAVEGRIIDDEEREEDLVIFEAPPIVTDKDLDQIAVVWNDAVHEPGIVIPDEDEALLALVGAAAKACAEETELTLTLPARKNGLLRLELAGGKERAELAIAVTNRGYQRGAFGVQIDDLRRKAGKATPIAVRTIEFPSGPACDRVLAQLLKAGGRRAYVDVSTLRALIALQRFQPQFPPDRVAAWRRRDRPISSMPAMIELFDLKRLRATPAAELAGAESRPAGAEWRPTAESRSAESRPVAQAWPAFQARPVVETRPAAEPRVARSSGTFSAIRNPPPPPAAPANGRRASQPAAPEAAGPKGRRSGPIAVPNAAPAAPTPTVTSAPLLRIGVSAGFHTEPREIDVSTLLRHTGILGSSGSGKTTLALNLIEQVLERDVAVVLVDRKGDLAGYAKPDWWKGTSDPERARRLADRLDVRLFTPGTRAGRPLSLSVVPDLEHVPEHERDRMVQYAAQALAAMMRLGDASADAARRAILTQAIAVLSERRRGAGLPELIALLEERDDALVARASRYDDKLFKGLVQQLETVRLTDADLFEAAAEPLTAETLIGRKPDGKVPLAIASTRFLGDVERVQSWVAHLIGCLSRHVAKTPSTELRMLFMIDEADLFMPAGMSKPPSKEPLQDLLKRARAAGLGVVLASQSPADFDYRSREQISTWFLGRIADRRSIDKMKPLFEHRPTVGGKLGTLEAGRFVMLQDGGAVDLERAPSLLRTEQLSEDELMALAARGRGGPIARAS